jgi:hypothetical protein
MGRPVDMQEVDRQNLRWPAICRAPWMETTRRTVTAAGLGRRVARPAVQRLRMLRLQRGASVAGGPRSAGQLRPVDGYVRLSRRRRRPATGRSTTASRCSTWTHSWPPASALIRAATTQGNPTRRSTTATNGSTSSTDGRGSSSANTTWCSHPAKRPSSTPTYHTGSAPPAPNQSSSSAYSARRANARTSAPTPTKHPPRRPD